MPAPGRAEPPVTPAEVRPRDITAALRQLYPHISLSATAQAGGTFLVRMPEATARYWGIERDPRHAAAWLTRNLPRPVEIRGVRIDKRATGNIALVTVAVSGQPRPADPGSSLGVPGYATVGEVIGDFPATRPVRALIQAALDGGLRPHLDPCRSPHGPRYRVLLWGTGETPLTGVLDISETTGRFAGAWLAWGRGPETRYGQDQAGPVRAAITSARDLHRAGPAAPGPGPGAAIHDSPFRLASLESPAAGFTPGARSPGGGPVPSRRRPARPARPARQPGPGRLQ